MSAISDIVLHHELDAIHCRQGRAALDWTQQQLADEAQVVRDTISNFEKSWSVPRRAMRAAIFFAMERAGIRFVRVESGEIAVFLKNKDAQNTSFTKSCVLVE